MVLLALLLSEVFTLRRRNTRLAYMLFGTALAQLAVLLGVIEFRVGYVALFGRPHWCVSLEVLGLSFLDLQLSPEALSYPAGVEALHMVAWAVITALGTEAGLAVAVASERRPARAVTPTQSPAGPAVVTSESSSVRATAATSSTARRNAACTSLFLRKLRRQGPD